MKTTTLWLDQCMPGMRVAETITNQYMAPLVNAGTVLDDRIIEKLKFFERQKLRVYIESDKEIENNAFAAVRAEYRENVMAMKGVLLDISSGKSVDMPTIGKVADMMQKRRGDIVGVLACLNQVRDSDEYTYSHSLNVAYISMFIGKWMHLNGDSIEGALEAGLLHDVGKCRIPGEILNKPSSLTDTEFEYMKKHPLLGFNILDKTRDVRKSSALAALEHHEKINGAGYPLGLSDKKIHPYGKIAAVADIYDAMTSNRAYHVKASPFQVFRILEDLAYGSLEPAIVVSFIQNLAGYYVGDQVTLSDGRFGHIVFINPRAVSRPIIQTEYEIVDLNEAGNRELYIRELI